MARKRWSDETKAAAIADLAAGMTVKDVAKKYDMPRSTAGALTPSSKAGALKIQKIMDLQDLEAMFRHQLALNFAAQEAILRQFTNAEWLAKQSASDVIGSYATLFTKGGKLLGALYGPPAAPIADDSGEPEDAA
jgi:hypothetical protein